MNSSTSIAASGTEGIMHGAPIAGFWSLMLGSIGVVYGDIGTSPLYAMRESVLAAVGPGNSASEPVVLGILSHILFGRGRLRFCGIKERAVTVLPLLLESLPGSLAESLIPQGPEERRDEDDRRDQIVQRVRLAYERVILGDWFLGHHILPFNVARRYWLCSHLEKMSEMSSQRVYPPGICFLPAM